MLAFCLTVDTTYVLLFVVLFIISVLTNTVFRWMCEIIVKSLTNKQSKIYGFIPLQTSSILRI